MQRIVSKGTRRKRNRLWDVAIFIVTVIFSFFLAGDLHQHGIAQKWGTPIVGTLLTFGMVIYAFRSHLIRGSFWISLLPCIGLHAGLMWFIFGYLLSDHSRFPPLLWLPFILVEIVVLLVLVKRIEESITGKHEVIVP